MKQLTDDELRMNQQASTVAASVLGEPVVAATRCEQVNIDMAAEAAGIGRINRGLMRGMMAMNKATKVGGMGDTLRTAGLPNSFVLAVTATQVHAVEDKRDHGQLVAGKVLRSWERAGVRAKLSPAILNTGQGVPEDRQVISLLLPIEGGNNRYLQAAARNTAAVGGKPYKFMVAKDAPSQAVIEALAGADAAANPILGATNLQDMIAQAQAGAMARLAAPPAAASAVDPVDRLSKLAELRERGILTDEEFAAQKSVILGS